MSFDLQLSATRIIDALRERKVKQTEVARMLGLPSSAVSNIFNGRRQLKLKEANILTAFLGDTSRVVDLPVIGLAGAGAWLEAIEQTTRTMVVPADVVERGGRFVIQVSGESMNLVLPEGSAAVVNPDDVSLFSGKTYLLRNSDGEATIKRYRSDPARFEPVSDDPSFEAFELGAMDFRVIGRVMLAIREL